MRSRVNVASLRHLIRDHMFGRHLLGAALSIALHKRGGATLWEKDWLLSLWPSTTWHWARSEPGHCAFSLNGSCLIGKGHVPSWAGLPVVDGQLAQHPKCIMLGKPD